MNVLLGPALLIAGFLSLFVLFPGILGLFPAAWFLGSLAVAFVGWRNRGDIHARENFLGILPWMITVIAIAAVLSLTR